MKHLFNLIPVRTLPGVLLATILWAGGGGCAGESVDEGPGFWTRAAWYVPNRVLDLVDIVRARVKVGPGLGVGARATDYFSFYGGRAHSVYFGLPGPRGGLGVRPPLGLEQTRGMVVMGLDATDALAYSPMYAASEIGLSLHALVVGAELTVSPNEFLDFLGGWFGMDPSRDDLPGRPTLAPVSFPRPMIGPVLVEPAFPLEPRPDTFDGLGHRLDFVAENVPRLVRSEMYALDRWLIGDREAEHEQPPVTDLRLALYFQWISGPGGSQSLSPELDLRLELPNAEEASSIFLQSSYDDELPGVDRDSREDQGWSLGIRNQFDKWNVSSDVGIHSKWLPELFGRLYWHPAWEWGEWNMGFEQRLFWENEDGFGLLSSLRGYHWLDDGKTSVKMLTAGRFSEATKGYEWQHTWTLAHLRELVDENKRRGNPDLNNTLSCGGWKVSVFGSDRLVKEYRTQVVFRKPVYGGFVLVEVEPGLQWRNDRDWSTQYRLDIGMILMF